ncbi:MAG: methylenetetrahydrofolate reductase [Chloroflexota bacterium]|nr:methylenetetrahydrofolate reductase [Chloroflexota bacterium]MDE2941545.1 methylenetetrahydrofolate reductase [Chloroflexota bacterium]MDE3267521.1 methylenetetrahydrofolate reductase [Chloroflexota bacterium]
MNRVSECTASDGPVFICDFSPPRGSDPALLDGARLVDADFLSVAHSPGRSVRANSAMTAHAIRQRFGKDVVFTIATRDMNRLTVQSHLLGAALLGLENVIVLAGDVPQEAREADSFRPTGLIRTIKDMNRAVDYRGLRLRSPTSFCVGTVADPGRDVRKEASLAHDKVTAGADFLVTQPVFDLEPLAEFLSCYRDVAGEELPCPLFVGLQVPAQGGLSFSAVPENVRRQLDAGRPGEEIAAEMGRRLIAGGHSRIYLVPPILSGGRRDYAAAQRVIEALRE